MPLEPPLSTSAGTDPATGPAPPRLPSPSSDWPPSVRMGWRGDLVTAVLGAWLVGGAFLDGWAHNTRPGLETFFTPWHAVLYSGYAASAAWLCWSVRSHHRRPAQPHPPRLVRWRLTDRERTAARGMGRPHPPAQGRPGGAAASGALGDPGGLRDRLHVPVPAPGLEGCRGPGPRSVPAAHLRCRAVPLRLRPERHRRDGWVRAGLGLLVRASAVAAAPLAATGGQRRARARGAVHRGPRADGLCRPPPGAGRRRGRRSGRGAAGGPAPEALPAVAAVGVLRARPGRVLGRVLHRRRRWRP